MALAIGVVALSSTQARDSVSLSINIGGSGYYANPVVTHYVASQVVYYSTRRVYHATAYAYPAVVHRSGHYYSGHRHYRGHRYNHDSRRR